MEDAQSALVEAEGWLAPATMESLARALGELYMRTARQKEDSSDRQAVILLYARELSRFPGDLALAAIQNYRGVYFPALDEIRGPLEASERLNDRHKRIRAMRDFVEGRQKPEADRAFQVTEAQRERNRAYAAELRRRLNGEPAEPFSDDDLARLAAVDAEHGERARRKDGTFKHLRELTPSVFTPAPENAR